MEKKKIKPMVRLSQSQIDSKKEFIRQYIEAENASSGSTVDSNANVSVKTVATLGAELNKDIAIQVNRSVMCDYIEKYFDRETAEEYVKLLEEHTIYKHDETSVAPMMPYCTSINMYPFLESGMTKLGGESTAPKHLESYCGSFINLIFAISSQFAGAVASVEFPYYFHYFATKDYGKDYLKTNPEMVKAKLQHVVYSINQPAASRGYQSTFWNISVFDKYFFESMFGNFYFPDGTHLDYEGFNEFQKFFMEFLLEERKKTLLTFPVLTEASLDEDGKPKDEEWADYCADIRSRGLSFFSYNSESVDALASCCRLRNAVENTDFSYSLGAGGIETGSHSVITLDLVALFGRGYDLEDIIKKVHKFQYAHRMLVQDGIDAGLLPAYSAGFIHLDKQFSTLGVNGLNEAAEEQGLTVGNNPEYKEWVANVLGTFKRLNMEARNLYNGAKYNTELVPAENLGVKNSKWDKKAGFYNGKRECYNSYMYLSESDMTSIPDKFELHGSPIADNLDGGSALHLNLSRLPDKEFFIWLRKLAAKYKCNYWTTNVKGTVCNDCGHHNMDTFEECPKCGSKDLDYHTRVIGYCKKISAFSGDRKKEESLRYYH